MSDIIQVFQDRRSIRAYDPKPIPDDLLHQIVTESYYSPNAGNKQLLRMVICKNAEINDFLGKLRNIVVNRFWYPEKGDYKATTDADVASPEAFNAFYGAPAVVYLFGPKDFEFAEADAYIMSNNLCLIARNYGVGSVIQSVAVDYFVTDRAKQILADWQIPEDYCVRAGASLGYPANGFPDPVKHDKYATPLFVE